MLVLQYQLEAAAKDLPGAVLATRKFFGGGYYVSTLWGFHTHGPATCLLQAPICGLAARGNSMRSRAPKR